MNTHRWLVLFASLVLTLSACGGGNDAPDVAAGAAEEAGGAGATDADAEGSTETDAADATDADADDTTDEPAEVTSVRLAFPTGQTSFANCDVMVGIDQGFFADEGLELSTENLGSGLKVVQALVAGDFDIGGASIEPVINAVTQGQPMSIIGTYADRLTVSMVVPNEIEEVGQLEDKLLGIQDVGAFREVMTRMVLESAGLGPDDVNYRGIATTGYIGALVGGQIDSAVLHAEQVADILSKDPSFHALVDLYEVEPNYFYGTYFVDNAWLNDGNGDVAEGFVTGLLKSHRFMYENREETVSTCSEVTGYESEAVDQAYEKYFETNLVFPVNSGLDEDRIDYTIDRMDQLGTLADGDRPSAVDFVNHEFMDAAIEELGEEPERSG